MEEGEGESLYMRAEHMNSMVVISTHNIIANDPQLAPRYLATQEQAVTHFEDNLRLLGDESKQAWKGYREYHSPKIMRDAIERTPMYKKALQRLKIN